MKLKGLEVRGNCRQLIVTGWYSMEVLAEREGRTRRPHIKGAGSQSKLPTINCTGGYSMEVLVQREGGSGEEATYERG